ncbi:TPA: hypothetical protein L3932_004505 [Pseudomonas aeruginosa]|nr:hypothetical protein [Pseudomonas aeruginosa]
MEIKRKDFRAGGKGDSALAESMLAMNAWLKEKSVKPFNVETLVDTSSNSQWAGLGGAVSTNAVGVRLWYSEGE